MRPGTYRLPTVTLVHRTNGRRVKINATDYARDIAGYKDWKLVSQAGGNAPDKVVEFERQQSDVEKQRQADPTKLAYGDHRRLQESRSSQTNIVTEPPPSVPAADAPPVASQQQGRRGRGRPSNAEKAAQAAAAQSGEQPPAAPKSQDVF